MTSSGLSVRRLSDDELRGRSRSGTVAVKPAKLDFTRAESDLYSMPEGFGVVDAPARSFLAIDTHGSPRTCEDYRVATEALYAAVYGAKLRNKDLVRRGAPGVDGAARTDFSVPPLERIRGELTRATVDDARWTLLLRVPSWIADDEIADALERVEVSKSLPAVARVYRTSHPERTYLQTGVTGSWSRSLIPVSKATAVELRERGLVAAPEWYEACLDNADLAADQPRYILRRRV
ncbi:hypothetical protein P0W64_11145 [Tsukamurella sp. 8F]|uniref:hypothetical protein n=1 Tax=unclassified Tsukamurella TaxID=2633480 RepID=UPI0023B8C61E|nr:MULTISPECIES: hypothetical protein [unclassified Tsukamurella]MDF0529903.1 hypothetical protein [Tsukamurella sp. 8J]MDF0587325.1 hypothetical protein [Tsukamurella sp. 8F]